MQHFGHLCPTVPKLRPAPVLRVSKGHGQSLRSSKINGQCTVSDLHSVLMDQGLWSNGPTGVACSHNSDIFREGVCVFASMRLPMRKRFCGMMQILTAQTST